MGRGHAESTHLADSKFASLSSVGVRIVGRYEKSCQRLKVHVLSLSITDAEYRVIKSVRGSLYRFRGCPQACAKV